MTMTTEKRSEVIKNFRMHEGDTGSAEVQVALLTSRITELTDHFAKHQKDHSSRRGLLMMVGRRRKLLDYLKTHNEDGYKKLIAELGIRK